jgi:hypothetical protein
MSGPIPCPSCGQPVPPGRLACPSCGALVASVARVEPIAATGDDDDLAGVPPDPSRSRRGGGRHGAQPAAAGGAAAIDSPPGAPPPGRWSARSTTPETEDIVPGGTVPVRTCRPRQSSGPALIRRVAHAPPPRRHRRRGRRRRRAVVAAGTARDVAASAPPAATGGWIPPTPGPVGSTPAGVPPAASSVGTGAPGGTPRDAREAVPGRASILADLPFDAPDQLEGWLIALGGGLGIIGYFLPWRASLGTGIDGFFGSWGLGSVSHLPLFVFLVFVAALAVLPNRVATWVRSGVCGWLGRRPVRIVWDYLGSDASQLGALLCAVAAVLLIAGGIIAVAPGRAAHRGEDAQT